MLQEIMSSFHLSMLSSLYKVCIARMDEWMLRVQEQQIVLNSFIYLYKIRSLRDMLSLLASETA